MTDKSEVKLVATRSQMYRGRALRPRDSFSATEDEAADLVALRYASRDTTPEAKQPRYRRRDMRVEEAADLPMVLDSEKADQTDDDSTDQT